MATFTKQQLCRLYGISRETLRVLMNVDFLDELKAVGYKKASNILPPKVLNKFFELYGEPETTNNN